MTAVFASKTGIYPHGRITVVGNSGFGTYTNSLEDEPFNLPPGKYQIYGKYTAGPHRTYKQHSEGLPSLTKDYRIFLDRNPNKASINTQTGVIIFDADTYRKSTAAERLYILGHELGHFRSADEKKCDRMAENLLLEVGFNPSQVQKAAAACIRDYERILSCIHTGKMWTKP